MNKKIVLKKPPRGLPRPGHSWIYRSQIASTAGSPSPGDIVDVATEKNRFVGRGYYNPNSEIAVRLLSREPIQADKSFFISRIAQAAKLRERNVRDTNAWRVVSSEADGLPGLIIDRYADVAVIQFLTLGMERLRGPILEAVEEVLAPKGIYERSDSGSRRLEGLEEKTGWIRQDCGSEVVVVEKDLEFRLAFGEGHKTGFYLDQRDNRLFLRGLEPKGEALDAFCYEGAFSLHLARAGWDVTGLDIQESSVKRAEEHRKRNNLPPDKLRFKAVNVFDELKVLEKDGTHFDLIILDPPSFVKKKSAIEGALAGYREILHRSMRILKENGRLAVFSCSYHVDDNLLMQSSMSAALDVKKSLRVVKFMKQAADHPIDPFIPETYYLKGFLFEVSSVL